VLAGRAHRRLLPVLNALRHLVVWQSDPNVLVRRFDATGHPVGPEFPANRTLEEREESARCAQSSLTELVLVREVAQGVPVYELLGGAVHDRLPMYASAGTPTLSIEQLRH
jgi:hypothetical protein